MHVAVCGVFVSASARNKIWFRIKTVTLNLTGVQQRDLQTTEYMKHKRYLLLWCMYRTGNMNEFCDCGTMSVTVVYVSVVQCNMNDVCDCCMCIVQLNTTDVCDCGVCIVQCNMTDVCDGGVCIAHDRCL